MEEIYKWVLVIIGGLIAAIWRDNKKTQATLEKRLSYVEKNTVTKNDFIDLKKDIKDDFEKLLNAIERLNEKVVTREIVKDIAGITVSDAILCHQNKCPYVQKILNGNN